MPRNGTKNLIPVNERTKEEQKEICTKGGKKSGEVRRQKSAARNVVKLVLAGAVPNDNVEELIRTMGLPESEMNVRTAMLAGTAIEAIKGNVQATKYLLDLAGETVESQIILERAKLERERFEHQKRMDETASAFIGMASPVIPDGIWRELMNPAYAEHLTDDRQTQIFFGGSSSGKSYAMLGQRVVRDLMKGERNYLICRKTARTLRHSCFNEVCKCITRMELSDQFKINRSEMSVTCVTNGRQALFAGLDDVEKVKSITPAKGVLTDILIEEATETDYDDYKQLTKRLRGGDGALNKRVTLLFNPILQDHWIYTNFFAGRWDDTKNILSADDLLILRTTYKDNRFLTQEDIDRLENEPDKYYYEVYTLGRWGVLGKLIFTNWKVGNLKELAKVEAKPRNGLDFGWWPDPNAYVRAGLNREKKEIYVYRTAGDNMQDNKSLADMLKPIVGLEVVRCDNNGERIHELNNNGIAAIPAVKGPGSIMFGIDWLRRYTIIVDEDCHDLIMELRKYKYKEDRHGNVLPEPVDKDNHRIDALRYAFEDDMLEVKVS